MHRAQTTVKKCNYYNNDARTRNTRNFGEFTLFELYYIWSTYALVVSNGFRDERFYERRQKRTPVRDAIRLKRKPTIRE